MWWLGELFRTVVFSAVSLMLIILIVGSMGIGGY